MGRNKSFANCEVLPNGDVVLHVGNVCIQTAAKRARDELVTVYLDGLESATCVERSIELLGRFLQTTDFGQLRSRHPKLAGGTECRVRLQRCEDGAVQWKIAEHHEQTTHDNGKDIE